VTAARALREARVVWTTRSPGPKFVRAAGHALDAAGRRFVFSGAAHRRAGLLSRAAVRQALRVARTTHIGGSERTRKATCGGAVPTTLTGDR